MQVKTLARGELRSGTAAFRDLSFGICTHTAHTIRTGGTLVKRFLGMQTRGMPPSPTRKEVSYPLSFRVPFSQVEEIDRAVARERRKRRSDLLEAIWMVAWTNYQRSGSLEAFAEGRRSSKRTKRVSEELQDQLYMALETILERAPSAVIEEVARKLTHWAGKYGDEK